MKYISSLFLILALCSCVYSGKMNNAPVNPESLIDSSAEKTSFSLHSEKSIEELTSWIDQDSPTRAELACAGHLCSKVAAVLSSFAIPYKHVAHANNKNQVVLLYEKNLAHDCTMVNGVPTFMLGCASSVNMVDMISDKHQLISPSVSGTMDASRAIKAIKNMNEKK